MHLQNFIKSINWSTRYWAYTKFRHQSRTITLLKMNEKYCSIIQIYILSISMDIQTLIGIHKLIHKIFSIICNKILRSIKGHDSVKIDQTLRALDTTWSLYVTYQSIYIILSTFIHLFWRRPYVRLAFVPNMLSSWNKTIIIIIKILRKNTFLHQSRAITLFFINEFSPFAIPNHSSPISISMRSLKKIGQKLLK